jgi:Ca-activated chloride channel family protein
MEESGAKTLSPYFVVISEHPETDRLPLKETGAQVNIVGVIADVTVRQKYVNSGKNTLEAIYTFPLSTKAAVYAMKMTIGKRVITARISEKEKARKDYNRAKTQGKRVSLLEQNRPNVFTMKVANIAQQDTIVVELKYTELLVPEKGIYSFVYPTVVGPRYSNKTKPEAGLDGRFVETPYTKKGIMPTYKFKFNLKINSEIPIQDVTCTTHKIKLSYPDLKTATVKLDPGETNGGNRDLILNYSLQGNKIESGVMLYSHGDENFFLMMVQPPKRVLEEEIPPREYIFIMDVSGSMNGFPISISKKVLRNLILNLRPTDKFNVVLFSGSTGLLSESSINANPENIEKAISLIEKQQGGGGTELINALKCAYDIPRRNENVSRSIVLITDGYVDVEKEAFKMIRQNNNNSNFFCFGIGTSVNRYLLEGMSFMGNGEPIIVDKEADAEKQAEKFRNYINTPVLSQIKTGFGNLDVYDVEPASIPDMLAERPVLVFGKYKGAPNGIITLKGNTGKSVYKKTFDLSTLKPNKSFSAIRYLWARERIKLLDYTTNQIAYYMSQKDFDQKDQITQLGLKYGLMTQYTSFIAIDENYTVDKDKKLVRVKQPLPLPQGVSNSAVGGKRKFSTPVIVKDEEVQSQEELTSSTGAISISDVKGYDTGTVDIADVKSNVTQVVDEKIYTVVEQMPQFPGGETALMNYIAQNLNYPKTAQDNGIQGKVIVRFSVEKDGSISKVEVVRSLDPACDKEAIRIIKSLPKFIPAKQNGVNVAVWYTLPITFKLK